MFSKIKKVLVSLVLASSLALAPMSNVSAMINPEAMINPKATIVLQHLYTYQYYKVEAMMCQLGITYNELVILNDLDIITAGIIAKCPRINKTAVITAINNMVKSPPANLKAYITAHKSDLATIRNKLMGK